MLEQHGIDFLYQHAGYRLMSNVDAVKRSSNVHCDICDRPYHQWVDPDHQVIYLNSYKQNQIHCLACHSLFVTDREHIGWKKPRGKMKKAAQEQPTATTESVSGDVKDGNKVLFGLKGLDNSGAIIAPGIFHLMLTETYYAHVQRGRNHLFTFEQRLASDVLPELLDSPPDSDILFITAFGKNTKKLVRNLRVSKKGQTLYACSEKQQQSYRYNDGTIVKQLKDSFDKRSRSRFVELVKGISCGTTRPDSEVARAFWAENPKLLGIAKKMPIDPHARLALLKMIK